MAADLIERWLKGSITNYEFDDAWPWRSVDCALPEIGEELWHYFGDNREELLTPSSLQPEQLEVMDRCYDFLKTDLPYQHKVFPQPKTVLGTLKAPFTEQPILITEDEKRYWPFPNMEEWDRNRTGLRNTLNL